MTTHTPGPWIPDGGYVRYMAKTGAIIADCEFFGVQAEANGRLIAAAPELLEALKAYSFCSSHNKTQYCPCNAEPGFHNRANQAIAKVEGK